VFFRADFWLFPLPPVTFPPRQQMTRLAFVADFFYRLVLRQVFAHVFCRQNPLVSHTPPRPRFCVTTFLQAGKASSCISSPLSLGKLLFSLFGLRLGAPRLLFGCCNFVKFPTLPEYCLVFFVHRPCGSFGKSWCICSTIVTIFPLNFLCCDGIMVMDGSVFADFQPPFRSLLRKFFPPSKALVCHNVPWFFGV